MEPEVKHAISLIAAAMIIKITIRHMVNVKAQDCAVAGIYCASVSRKT